MATRGRLTDRKKTLKGCRCRFCGRSAQAGLVTLFAAPVMRRGRPFGISSEGSLSRNGTACNDNYRTIRPEDLEPLTRAMFDAAWGEADGDDYSVVLRLPFRPRVVEGV